MTSSPTIEAVVGSAVVLPGDDVDTDRIIPARFMRAVTFDGLGRHLFHDARAAGGHPLDRPGAAGASVLVVGGNFGCGSSREHAAQAIRRAGFRAVVGRSFASIFFGNATALGVPCVALSAAAHEALVAALLASPGAPLCVDLLAGEVCVGERAWPASIPEGVRAALLAGRWDPLTELADAPAEVRAVAALLPYVRW